MKFSHRRLCFRTEYAVGVRNGRYGWVVFRDPIEPELNIADLVSGIAEPERGAGIRFGQGGDGGIADDGKIVAIIIGKNFVRRPAVLREIHAPPLRQTIALHPHTVTIRGKQRLHTARAPEILVEYLIDKL